MKKTAPILHSHTPVFFSVVGLFLITHVASVASPLGKEPMPESLAGSDWTSIRAAYEAGRHQFQMRADGAFVARNPGQQWSTEFDGRGFTTRPEGKDWEWGLDLTGYGRGDDQALLTHPKEVSNENSRLIYRWNEVLEEWFLNDTRGLEQGWNFSERPAGAAEETLHLSLAVRGSLRPEICEDGETIRFLDSDDAPVVTYGGLKAWDARKRSLPVSFVLEGELVRVEVDERNAIYPITIDPLAQQVFLKASNPDTDDMFGQSVSVSGDTVVVGAMMEDSIATGIDGDGSNNDAPDSGAAYVFVRNGSTWSQQAYLKASNAEAGDNFGQSVSVNGDTIVVGALRESSNAAGIDGDEGNNGAPQSGAAYVFSRDGSTWIQQAYLKASNTETSDLFGQSVSLSGDTVVVGATNEGSNATGIDGNVSNNSVPGSGATYVFIRSGSTWTQQAYLKASNTGFSDNFGGSISLSGDTLVVGSPQESSSATGVNGDESDDSAPASGAAYLFVRNGATWIQEAYIKASNTEMLDYFGSSVSVSGDFVVVGAQFEDSSATGVNGNGSANGASDSGAAYVFVRNGTSWSEEAFIKASNTQAFDYFGSSVSVSGDTVVVGASYEGSSATGVNGNESDNTALGSGAAYVFVRSGSLWNQEAYLKASNTEADDNFGLSVSVSGDTVVVGALEDSNSPGVNGDEGSNAANLSGAVYVFDLAAGGGAYPRFVRPDLRIGCRRNINRMSGNDIHNRNAVGQRIRLSLTGLKWSTYFFALENDGNSADRIRLNETGRTGKVKTKYFLIGGGRQNITAELKSAGRLEEPVNPGAIVRYEARIMYKTRTSRPRQNVRLVARSMIDTSKLDAVRTIVTGKRKNLSPRG